MKYTISTLAQKTGLSIHTLRFYEKQGILRHVERTASGRRVYGEASLGCLLAALCLKQLGVSLVHIKEYFDQTIQGVASLPTRLEMMCNIKRDLESQIEKLQQNIRLADFFINGCKSAMKAVEKGEDADAAFPFLTREGFIDFPFTRKGDGKLVPNAGIDFSTLQTHHS